MRRYIALVATALVAPALAMAAPATAHAAVTKAPSNPVDALRAQFAKKSTVRMDASTRMWIGKDELLSYRQVGVLRFGKNGPEASDTRTVIGGIASSTTGLRAIVIDGKAYLKSPLYDELLPAGRTWVRTTAPKGSAGPTSSFIDVLQPKVLKTVLGSVKTKTAGGKVGGAKTTLLRGSVSLTQLAKVSPSLKSLSDAFRSLALKSKSKKPVMVPWKLWVGGDQLPRRFQSTLVLPTGSKSTALTIGTDSRLTAWGAKVVIQAPPAVLVVDEEDLQTDLPTTPDFTTVIPRTGSHEH